MEIQGTDGSKIQLKPNSTTVFGRANQSHTNDLSISRHHISFDIISSPNSPNTQTSPRVSFEVLGKNPIWVYKKNWDQKFKTFKRFQRGELGIGDLFCVSGKNPVWFTLKEVENEVIDDRKGKSLELGERINEEFSQSLENNSGFDENDDFGFDFVDVSSIDPAQEFGFLVIGHEFDQYPSKIIRPIKNWDWFLEDPVVGDSEDEETGNRKGKKGGRKRKKTSGDDDVDDEWTAEGEGEELGAHASKIQKPKYHTRSKDGGSSGNKRTKKKTSPSTSSRAEEEESENEDDEEQDETLGGFIVDDETVEEEEDEVDDVVDEDDEEEFVEDEDERED